jgi:hypothetical protein
MHYLHCSRCSKNINPTRYCLIYKKKYCTVWGNFFHILWVALRHKYPRKRVGSIFALRSASHRPWKARQRWSTTFQGQQLGRRAREKRDIRCAIQWVKGRHEKVHCSGLQKGWDMRWKRVGEPQNGKLQKMGFKSDFSNEPRGPHSIFHL